MNNPLRVADQFCLGYTINSFVVVEGTVAVVSSERGYPLTSFPGCNHKMAEGGESSFQQQTRERLSSLKAFTTTNFSRAKQVICFINLLYALV